MKTVSEEIKCLECEKVYINTKSFGMHLSKTHKMKHEAYTLKWKYCNVRPTCKCGCNEETNWSNVHHKFMTYKSGHNDNNNRFTTSNQPVFTKDQIKHRNSKIKEAYNVNSEKGLLIRDKIRISVNETFLQPGFIEKLSAAQIAAQQKPDVKARVIISRQRTWDEQYDSLYKKIFTEEFGQKISEANMRRDVKKQSAAEIAFFDHLKLHIPNVQTSVWMNNLDLLDKKKTFCFDGKINDFLIEFDGLYWHGLDRSKNWNNTQLSNISNDLKKSLVTSQNNLNLIRIKEGIDYSEIKSFETLFDAAYYIQVGKDVIKGSQCAIDESDIIDEDNQIDYNSLLEFLLLYSTVFDRNIDTKKIKQSNTLKIKDVCNLRS